MEPQRLGARGHLHFPERSKCVHAFRFPGINVLNALLNLLAEGGIEPLDIRFVVWGTAQRRMAPGGEPS
jgi:hypothetical protein